MREKKSSALLFAVIILLAQMLGAESLATELKEDRVDVFQLKSVTKKRRLEVMPLFSLSLNDPFVQVLRVGLSGAFHLTEGLALEIRGWYSFSSPTAVVGELRRPGDLTNENPGVLIGEDGSSSNDIYNPTISLPQIYAFGSIVWSPLIGKFSLGKAIYDFDIFFRAGMGYIRTRAPAANLLGFSVGAGWRVFLAKWLSLNLEFQGLFYAQGISNKTILIQHLFFTVGFGFFFPFEPNYST